MCVCIVNVCPCAGVCWSLTWLCSWDTVSSSTSLCSISSDRARWCSSRAEVRDASLRLCHSASSSAWSCTNIHTHTHTHTHTITRSTHTHIQSHTTNTHTTNTDKKYTHTHTHTETHTRTHTHIHTQRIELNTLLFL